MYSLKLSKGWQRAPETAVWAGSPRFLPLQITDLEIVITEQQQYVCIVKS